MYIHIVIQPSSSTDFLERVNEYNKIMNDLISHAKEYGLYFVGK